MKNIDYKIGDTVLASALGGPDQVCVMAGQATPWGEVAKVTNIRLWAARARLELRDMDNALIARDFELASQFAMAASAAAAEAEIIADYLAQVERKG